MTTSIEIVANTAASVEVLANASASLDILANTPSAVTVAIATPGPMGPAGLTEIGGYGFNVSNLQIGDHVEFSGSNWINVAKTTLSDGGNF